jgi:hypothetical protein
VLLGRAREREAGGKRKEKRGEKERWAANMLGRREKKEVGGLLEFAG